MCLIIVRWVHGIEFFLTSSIPKVDRDGWLAIVVNPDVLSMYRQGVGGESTRIVVVDHESLDELAFTHGRIPKNDNFKVRLLCFMFAGIVDIVGIVNNNNNIILSKIVPLVMLMML